MRIAKSIVLALVLLISTSARATAIWHTSTIKIIYPYAGGIRFVLAFETEHPNCTNTQTPRKYYYVHSGANGVTVDDVNALCLIDVCDGARKVGDGSFCRCNQPVLRQRDKAG